MDHPETNHPPAAIQIPESHPPPARKGLWSRFLSAWNANPWQMRLVLISLLLYMADVITDLMLAYRYYSNGDYHWCGWTIGFVMAPPTLMNIILLAFGIDLLDIKLSLGKWDKFLLNFTRFAPPLIKYVEVINLLGDGKKVTKSVEKKLRRFHLIEAMLESLPQLCLQIYIFRSTHEQVSVLKVISILISLLAAVKAVVTYMYYDRYSTYKGSRLKLVILLTIWKVSELIHRVFVIVLFASFFKEWVMLHIGIHWLVIAFCIVITLKYEDGISEACLQLVTCVFCTFPDKENRDAMHCVSMNIAITLLVMAPAIVGVAFNSESSWDMVFNATLPIQDHHGIRQSAQKMDMIGVVIMIAPVTVIWTMPIVWSQLYKSSISRPWLILTQKIAQCSTSIWETFRVGCSPRK